MKRIIALLAVLSLLLSGCKNKVIVDAGGITTERDVMVREAQRNTP